LVKVILDLWLFDLLRMSRLCRGNRYERCQKRQTQESQSMHCYSCRSPEFSREIPAPESIVNFHLYCTPFGKTGKEKVTGETVEKVPKQILG